MNYLLFIGVAIVIGCLYMWIGIRASKDVKTNEDYFLMGRKLTFLPLCLTLLATQLGGGTLLGAAQEAYLKGWIVLIYPLGAAIGLVVLGMGFGSRLRKLNISTIAEIFETVYKSRFQRLIASWLSVISLFFILVAQGIAARKFLLAFGIGEAAFVLFWLAFVAYTVMGGLKAVVDTDIIQAVLIVIGLILAWFSIDWSFLSISAVSAQPTIELISVPWSSWLLMPMLFMLIEQDMGQRCFAAKTPGVVGPSAIVAGLMLFMSSSIAVAFGVLARDLNIEINSEGSILLESVKALTNPAVSTLVMGSILMAIASSADSILCSISSNLSCDLLGLDKEANQSKLNMSCLMTLLTGLAALATGYLFDNVVTVLMLAYELSVCVLFVPVVAAVISNNPSRLGAICSMTCGAFGFIIARIFPVAVPKEIFALILSSFGYWIALLTTYQVEKTDFNLEKTSG